MRHGKARIDAKGRNPDKTGSEHRTVIFRRSFWHAPHIASLSGAGRSLVIELQSMFNGRNNGVLFLSVRDAADRLGFTDLEAAMNAMLELESVGLVSVTVESSFAMKAGESSRARAYRLNWIGDDGKCVGGDKLPPLDFSQLSEKQKKRIASRGDVLERYLREQQKKKSAVRETLTLMTESVRETRTDAAHSVRESRTPKQENGGNAPSGHVRESLTHILHHIPAAKNNGVAHPGVADWQAEQQRIDREANAKRSAAAKEQHAVSKPRAGETKPDYGAATTSGTTKQPNRASTTKAAMSGTNRGTVERMDKLAPRNCAHCSKPFISTVPTKVYCGGGCKERAKARRHYRRAKALEAPGETGDEPVPGWAA